MKKFVIIVAAGTGSRMQAELPKQFVNLQDRPVLMHTISLFQHSSDDIEIIIVLSKDWISYWQARCEQLDFRVRHKIVAGGETRFHSVKNGLHFIAENYRDDVLADSVIGVHDAARPLVDKQLIRGLYDFDFNETKAGGVLPAIPSTSSMRIGDNQMSRSVDRNTVWEIQTPQVFPGNLLRQAYQQSYQEKFTDDASVIENLGYPISLLDGSRFNIKITFPEDIEIAQTYLQYIDLNR